MGINLTIFKDEPRVDTRLLVPHLNIKHRNIIGTISKYKNELEELGIFPFETEKSAYVGFKIKFSKNL